ncbi:MAG: hypothetical protein J6J43_02460, partial [Oscillospiraceae bacterium]|nr:hypothetical protein [Oscillospiraceae bacterium]
MKKRIVSLLLAVVMVLSLMPAALAADCQHANTTSQVVAGSDKTHTTTVTCDDCGVVVNADASADVIAIDFKEDAKAMAQQDFWSALSSVSTQDGNDAKRLGAMRNSAMSDEETTAYNAMQAWLNENSNWSFAMPEWEDNTNQSATTGKRVYLSADEDLAWGISLHTYVINAGSGSQISLNVQVPEAGYYDLALDIIPQTNEASDCPDDTAVFPGGATIDVYVNDALVMDDSTAPKGDEGAQTTAQDVYLEEGSNTVTIDIVSNYANISGYGNRVNVPLAGLSFSKPADCTDENGDGKCDVCGTVIGECLHMGDTVSSTVSNNDGTHTTSVTCAGCGAVVNADASADVIAIDFKEDAKAMAEQDFWSALSPVSTQDGNDAKRVGAMRNSTMSDEETAAYNAMQTWLSENAAWSFSMPEWADNTNQSATDGKRAYLSADEDLAWGLSLHTYVINAGSGSQIRLNVRAQKAGYYDLALDIVPQTNESTDCPDDTAVFPGGATIDVYVNGALVLDDSTAPKGEEGAQTTAQDVYLEAGSNTVTIDIVSNYANISGYGNRVNVPLAGMSFSKPAACADEDGDGKCDVCSYVTGQCQHKGETTSQVVSNGNGTHSTVLTCANCGETAAEDSTEKLVQIDFKEAAKAMAQQDFWNDLSSVSTLNGNDAKRVGVMWNSLMSETEKAAYDDMQAWLAENESWSFHMPAWDANEDTQIGRRAYLSADEDVAWGLSLHTFVIGTEGYSDLALNVTVPETGYYDLTLDVIPQTNESTDSVEDTSVFPGGATITVYANGTAILENSDICKGTERTQLTLENVYLEKGAENEIKFFIVTNWAGTTSPFGNRVNVPLRGMSMSKAASCCDFDGDEVCDVCGGAFVCEHLDTEKTYETAENETHNVSGVCETCGEELAWTEECTDADKDRVCDLCGGGVACKHTAVEVSYVTAGNGTHSKNVVCRSCGNTVSQDVVTCIDEDANDACDLCGGTMSCSHTQTTVSYVSNGNGTHDKTEVCICGEEVDVTTETCVDEDEDGYCDGCEDPVEAACDHAETTSETVYNGDKTHTTTVTCVCGEVVSTETADCVDEDKDCACDTCEGVIKTVTKTTVAGSNMNLGNELQVNFIINDPKVAGDYVAYIHQDTDDEGGVTYEIPSSDWEFFSTGRSKVGVR